MLRVRLLGGLALEAGERADRRCPRAAPRASCWRGSRCTPGRTGASSWPALLARRAGDAAPARACGRRCTSCAARSAPAAAHLEVDRERVGLRDVWVDLRDLGPAELLRRRGRALGRHRPRLGDAARDEHRERIAGLLDRLADDAADARGGAALDARAGPARPAVRGGHPPPDDAASPTPATAPPRWPRTSAWPTACAASCRSRPSRETRELLAAIRDGGGARGRRRAAALRPPAAAAALPARLRRARRAVRRPRRTSSRRRSCAGTRAARVCCSPASRASARRGCCAEAARERTSAARPCCSGAAARSSWRRTSRSRRRSGRPTSRRLRPGAEERPARASACSRPSTARSAPARVAAAARRPALGRPRHAAAARASCCARSDPARCSCSAPTATASSAAIAAAGRGARGPAPRRPGRARALRGLDAPAVARRSARRARAGELAPALHRETGGNPFFVEEILRHLDKAILVYWSGWSCWCKEQLTPSGGSRRRAGSDPPARAGGRATAPGVGDAALRRRRG